MLYPSRIMDIRIIHLPPGTSHVKRDILRELSATGQANDLSHILYLCPTRHILRNWKEDILHGEAGQCYIPPQAYTLKQYARKLALACDARVFPSQLRPVAIASLTNCTKGLAEIISETVSELIAHLPGKSPGEIKETVTGTFKSLGLPDDALKRAEIVMDAMSLYIDTIGSRGLQDEAALYEIAAKSIKDAPTIKALILDGFYELTGAELEFITALTANAERAMLTVPISGPDDDRHYCYSRQIEEQYSIKGDTLDQPDSAKQPELVHTMPSQEEEIEEIARRIKSDFLSGRTRDLNGVLVVFPSLSTYKRPAERIFRRYDIPVNRACLGQPMSKSRPWSDLLGLLAAVSDNYPRLAFARSLASPVFTGIPDEIRTLAPYVSISSGITGGKRAWIAAMNGTAIGDVFATLSPIEALDERASLSDCLAALIGALKPLGFDPGSDYMEALDQVSESFATLVSVSPGNHGLAGFIDALAIALDGVVTIDETPGVEIASIYDVRGLEPKVLYMGGLRDGELPSRPEMDFVLPDSVRGRLGLLDLRRHMHLQGFIFKRLTRSADSVRLSYPRMDGDKLYLPSVLLAGAVESEDLLRGCYCAQELQAHEGGPSITDRISEIRASSRGKSASLRVTEAENYMRCPRRFYIEKVLRLEPPRIMEYEVDAKDMGIITHEVMQRLVPRERVSESAFISLAEKALDEVLGKQKLDAYFKRLFRDTFIWLAPTMHAHLEELWDEGFGLMAAECSLESLTPDGVKLTGKADRIDIKQGTRTIQIVDYKTGGADISGGDIEKGTSLQLPLYAAMLSESGYATERFGIYSLKTMKMKWVPSSVDRKREHDADHFVRAAIAHLRNVTGGISKGIFTAAPADEGLCRSCHEMPFCPHHHTGGAA